jgi:hypothetical protein
MDEAKAWQARPLDALYPIVYLDCIHVKTRDAGAVRIIAGRIRLRRRVHALVRVNHRRRNRYYKWISKCQRCMFNFNNGP